MVKWMGYLLILAACFGLSEQAIGKIRDRRLALKHLLAWLSYFRGKILFENAAMEEALRESAKQAGAELSTFFCAVASELEERNGRTIREIWEEQSEQRKNSFSLGREEVAELKRFGTQLGEMDVKVQERAISRYEEELSAALKRVEEELSRKERLYRSLGVLAGCFIIILIW